MKLHFSLLALFLFASIILHAQTAEIRGFVYEEATSEPAIYTSVYLKGTTFGSQTNLDGFYSISRIPPGTYQLTITSIGFDTVSQTVQVKPGDLLTKKLFLKKSAVQIQEVEISGESQSRKTDVRVSVNKITTKEINSIPTVGGEPDLAQYLQVVPGVVFSGDQGGQLYIRGGTPIQNKVLLDGMIIYNPFHSIGLYSVIDADLIRGADVYTGGFNAEYGDRISSVMDITTRDGNKKRVSGKVSANTFTSKLILEGPLRKEKENGGSSSFLVSGRTSYLDKTSKTFYSYADSLGLPYSFNDLYGKISFNGSSGSKVNFFGFHFTDDVNYLHVADLGWKSTGIGANFVAVPSGSAVLIDGNFAYSDYGIGLKEADNRQRNSDISGFNFGLSFNYFPGKNEFRYGIEVVGFKTNFQFANSIGTSVSQIENTTEVAFYLKYKKVWDKVVLEPGLRLNYYSSLSEFSPEPRLGLKYNIADKFRFKAAAGLYSQNLLSTTSDRDVVNLFYGFLSGADNLQEKFLGEDVTSRLQKARHLIAGFEVDLPSHLTLNIEGYIKDFTQLENLNRNKIFNDDPNHNNVADSIKKDFLVEKGTSKGVDLTLKYEYKKVYLWFVYSLGFADRNDGTQTYQPIFDRRHNINLVASLKLGRRDQYMVNARFNYGSPFPFTQTQGFYESVEFPDGPGSDPTTQNGNLGIYYGKLNGGRLSSFHRLDISIQRKFTFGKYNVLEITAGATNVYDRKNIFYRNRITDEKVYQLPVIPNVGVTFSF